MRQVPKNHFPCDKRLKSIFRATFLYMICFPNEDLYHSRRAKIIIHDTTSNFLIRTNIYVTAYLKMRIHPSSSRALAPPSGGAPLACPYIYIRAQGGPQAARSLNLFVLKMVLIGSLNIFFQYSILSHQIIDYFHIFHEPKGGRKRPAR